MSASNKPEPVKVTLRTRPWGATGVLRFLKTARRNLIELIPLTAVYEPMLSSEGKRRWHMIMDPSALRHVMKDKVDNYPKADVAVNILREAVGDSVFLAHGPHWLWQRRLAAPVFSHRNIANLSPVMTAAAECNIDKLSGMKEGEEFDVYPMMVQTTFDVISDVTLSGDEVISREQMHTALDAFIERTGRVSLLDALGVPTWVPRPSRLLMSTEFKNLKRIADRAIDTRRERGSRKIPDLLDLFLSGEDPVSKRKMTTPELRDNLLTFIVAGHETSAIALSWSLYLCGFDPKAQEAAAAEAKSVLNGRIAEFDDVAKMPLTRQIIEEAMRLYPPVAMMVRTAKEDDEIIGHSVRSGDPIMLPVYALHRSHLLWKEPDQFDPNRFADRKSVDRFSYMPFGDGPRVCIGAGFAIQEAVIILGTLLSQYRFEAVKGKDPEPVMLLTLRPKGGVWLRAFSRT
ncbi:MAG: cytochrome P450 [Pseudoruegeria sp.]